INDNLNLELSSVRTELTDFKKSVETDIKGLKQLDADRKQERDQQKKNEQKFRKDSDRKNVVAAKPKLVEKQINNSFNKLSDDFTEMT
ncbi:hypothetical protein, partial [Klebsiella pneumoniae]|uniref:hypothetical protein n=1 Tax=Klebsiella pneumoniae TaxID=573 RepID=UPI00272FE356